MLNPDCYDDFIKNCYGKRACVLKKENFVSQVFDKIDCQQLINEMSSSNALEWTINGIITKPINKNSSIDINNIECLTKNFYFNDCEKNLTFSGHNCYHYIHSLQIKASQFLYPIFKIHGIPSNGVNIFIFGGKYRKTPVGLHSDACDIFCSQ